MSLADQASLLLIPSGYKSQKLYSIFPTNGVGDFDFSRSGSATRIAQNGLITTVDSNVPRLNYPMIDGKVVGCPHHILEPQRTNLIPYSEDFSNASWSKTGASATSGFTSPDGTTNAFKLVEGTNNGIHQLNAIGISTVVDRYNFSVFVKPNGRNEIRIVGTNYFSSGTDAYFNLETKVITYGARAENGLIETLANGWFRCSFSSSGGEFVGNNAHMNIETALNNSNSYQGDGTSGVYIYGAMVEQGSYATSYIPTQGSTVTRLADARTDSALPSTIVSQTEGTIFFKINKSESTGVANRELIVLETPNRASGGLIRVLTTVSKSVMRVLFQINGGIPFDVNIPSQYTPLNTDLKFAIAFKSGDSAVYINGVSTNTSTSTFTIPEQFDNFYLNFSEVKAKFSEIKLYNTRLSNSELQALTS